jgi:uncharacterized membrane protein YdjX (TVP38/TMEM64 family)
MTEVQDTPARRGLLRRLPLLLVLLATVGGALFLGDGLSFDALARDRAALLAFRDAHYGLAVAGFLAGYVAVVALSLPGATVATLAGGFLFGLFPGVLLNVAGASLGAVLIFLAVRAGVGAEVARRLERQGGAAARLMAGLRQNEWSVLFLMRLVPAVPFFLANLVPAFVGVGLGRFAVTTVLGILPATAVFTWVGAGLGEVFAAGGRPDLSVIVSPAVLGPILALAALSALPLAVNLWRRKG